MLKRIDVRGVPTDSPSFYAALPRPEQPGDEPVAAVRDVIRAVRERGDAALREFTARFDGAELHDIRVSTERVEAAVRAVEPEVVAALRFAAKNIADYHQVAVVEGSGGQGATGLRVTDKVVAVARAGCYVPGGRAAYPSTVLMTAIPAKAAGVAEVVLCTPPGPDGEISDVTLAAAAVAGVDEVYAVGGAQAVAAMAYGTESIRPVDVVVGPGNIYVAVAKREVAGAGVVGVPSAFTGPSEVVVLADETVDPQWVATDLAVQAEHGPDGLAWLVCWSDDVADAVCDALSELVAGSTRAGDITATLAANGYVVIVDGAREAMAVSNWIAPEHLQLMVANASELVELVRNAGAVFLGQWAPASLGDYVAGPSHVLPTSGSARFGSALRVEDFCKHVHVVDCDPAGFAVAGPAVVTLASAEGLFTHALSASRRLEKL